MERALIREFEHRMEQLLTALRREDLDRVTEIVTLFLDIRGYGPVKEQAVEEVRTRIANRISSLATMQRDAA